MATPAVLPQRRSRRLRGQAPQSPSSPTGGVVGSAATTPFGGKPPSGAPPQFTKPGRPGSVTFIDNFAFFVVCVNVDTKKIKRDDLTHLCQAVRREVCAAVEAGLENTHHRSSHPVPVFLCPRQRESCSTDLHTAHLSDDKKQWICSKNTDEFDYLTPDQALWLSGTGEHQCVMVQWIKFLP